MNTDGSFSQVLTFECDWPSLFTHMPTRLYSPSPDFSALVCDSAQAQYKVPGIAVVAVTYRGIPGSSLPPGDESMIVSAQEQPIETHPKFISDLAGLASAPKNGALFDDVTDEWRGWKSGSIYAGLETYLAPSITFRRNYASYGRPDITTVGSVWNPPDAPSGGGSKNWLCTGITWRRFGGYYSINEDSLLSGPKGWLPILYGGGTT